MSFDDVHRIVQGDMKQISHTIHAVSNANHLANLESCSTASTTFLLSKCDIPGGTGKNSPSASTTEKFLPRGVPMHERAGNDQFQSTKWSQWPKWNSYGFQKSKMFDNLLEPMLDLDTKQCAVWKEEVQNLLILAGLFSAVVTAFVIESYRMLQPDPNDQIIALLSRIADQTNVTNGNPSPHTDSLPTTPDFVPSPSNIRVNIFWFISLVLSLTVALIGIIAQQWLREHQLYRKDMNAAQHLAIFNSRSDGLQRWYIPQVFAGLPLLLQTALVLFFIGLVEFLFSIHSDVAVPVFAAVAVPITFLVATTILPTLQLCTMHFPYLLRVNDRPPAPCPYKSPQALIFQNVVILSTPVFDLFARAFSTLWIPFVIVTRLFVSSDKPFYGKTAPFSTYDDDYRCSHEHLRKAARKWMTMDIQWLAARTSYAVAIQTPHTVDHPQSAYISKTNLIEVIAFYDWVAAMKQVANTSDPTNYNQRLILAGCMDGPLQTLFDTRAVTSGAWADSIKSSPKDPEVAKVLQVRFKALLRIISSCGYQPAENLLKVSQGDGVIIWNAFFAVFADQAWGSELNFHDHHIDVRLATHMKLTRLYLLHNSHELFLCSNLPGITPSFLPSARLSLVHHRRILESENQPWMDSVSTLWTRTLSKMVTDVCKMTPLQPFTHKCTGSSDARCGSNLHTVSIVKLTEYILLFQVTKNIKQTLRLLHDVCESRPNPIQERPFVLIIACAYINAVANVNQDDVEGFSRLLDRVCTLCSSLNPALEARPGGKGRHWPDLELAFDYIRNNACDKGVDGTVAAAPQALTLHHNLDAAENV